MTRLLPEQDLCYSALFGADGSLHVTQASSGQMLVIWLFWFSNLFSLLFNQKAYMLHLDK